MTQDELNQVLVDAIADKALWKTYKPIFANNVSTENLSVVYMRALLTEAGPINDGSIRYKDIKDDRDAQDEIATDFQVKLREMMLTNDKLQNGVEMRIYGRLIYNVVFEETLAGDVAYAAFSGIFVFCFIWFHLESFFMALLSIFLILLSFPVSYAIYTGIF